MMKPATAGPMAAEDHPCDDAPVLLLNDGEYERGVKDAAERIAQYLGYARIGPAETIKAQEDLALWLQGAILELLAQKNRSGPPRVRHLRRGSTYTVLGPARIQTATPLTDLAEVVIYRGEDGETWARPVAEFEDGRFVPLSDEECANLLTPGARRGP